MSILDYVVLLDLKKLRVISRACKHSQGTFLVPLLPPSGKQFITRQEKEEGGKTDGAQRDSFAR